jgi:hypothetical protein
MPDHELDLQSEAFRGAETLDLVGDEELAALIASGALANTTDAPVTSVESYEAQNWDADREGSKTIAEARLCLAERVANPAAPDRDASAYDELELS